MSNENELLPCPFCGGQAESHQWWSATISGKYAAICTECNSGTDYYDTEAEAIAAWNSRAAMEFDNWFYLPKPKEPIVEVTETTHAWDGTKVKTDVFYQVQEQAVINWAKELDEHIIKRICEVWNTRAERTCRVVAFIEHKLCDEPDAVELSCGHDVMVFGEEEIPNYCPNCGCKVVGE